MTALARFAAAALAVVLTVPAGAQPASAAAAVPEVQWLRYELPPLYITQGPQEGQGALDRLLREVLLPQLAGLRHVIVTQPPKRLEATLQQLPNACVMGMLRNAERDNYLYFSRPFPISSTAALMVRPQDAARWRALLDDQGRISLRGWLAQGRLRLGLAEGRAYGATVDALLADPGIRRVERVTSQNPALNLMQILRRERIDGLLVMPFEPAQLARDAGLTPQQWQLLPLQEQGPTREGHVACTRTPLGAEVVRRADAVLASGAFRQQLAELLARARAARPSAAASAP